MSFSATLGKSGIRGLARTLQCLARIGAEVSVEALADKMLLRTLAQSHAAYALVSLQPEFFEPGSFCNRDEAGNIMQTPPSQTPAEAALQPYVKCKLHLKQLLMCFRHTQHSQTTQQHTRGAQTADSSVAGPRSLALAPSRSSAAAPPSLALVPAADKMSLHFLSSEGRLQVMFTVGGVKSKYTSGNTRGRHESEQTGNKNEQRRKRGSGAAHLKSARLSLIVFLCFSFVLCVLLLS